MKKKEKTSMQNITTGELMKIVRESEDKILHMKPAKNVREVRALRNKIAVSKTIMRAKELSHE